MGFEPADPVFSQTRTFNGIVANLGTYISTSKLEGIYMYALLVLPTSVALGLQMIGSFVGIVSSHFWCYYNFDSFLYMGHIMDHIVFSSVSILLSFSSTSSLHSNWDSLSQTQSSLPCLGDRSLVHMGGNQTC